METTTTTQQTKKSTSVPKKAKKTSTQEDVSAQVSAQVLTQVLAQVPVLAQAPVLAQVPVQTSTQESATVVEEETNEEFDNMVDFMNLSRDRFAENIKYFKENPMNKDDRTKFETSMKNMFKSYVVMQSAFYDTMSKQLSTLEKYANNKSSGVKKTTDKDKAAIHKKLPVHPFLLTFMKLEPGTLVSRSESLSAINGYVKSEKAKNPDIILENDKRSFTLIGELETLFAGIKKVMDNKKLLEGKEMPVHIKYTQIMEYMSHCFVKNDEPIVV